MVHYTSFIVTSSMLWGIINNAQGSRVQEFEGSSEKRFLSHLNPSHPKEAFMADRIVIYGKAG
jgi:hypothetical protein